MKMEHTNDMENGMRVLVRLAGEEPDYWHSGTVIKARKQWVEFDAEDPGAPFIADECCIVEWKWA